MSTELEVFKYGDGVRQVRSIVVDGEHWFVAADVCDGLGLTNVSQTLSKLDADEKSQVKGHIIDSDTAHRGNDFAIISEPGLYKLVLRSRKPAARQFARWVTHEVLPAIRQTGQYGEPGTVAYDQVDRLVGAVERQSESIDRLIGVVSSLVEQPRAIAADPWTNEPVKVYEVKRSSGGHTSFWALPDELTLGATIFGRYHDGDFHEPESKWTVTYISDKGCVYRPGQVWYRVERA